jgi:predicted phosphodiesterase
MRIAVIADIHGNLLALEAVLADIAMRGADLTVDLGDCVSGPLWPRETLERLWEHQFPTVRGNHERQLQAPRSKMGLSDAYAADQLSEVDLRALGVLPLTITAAEGVLMCHATPSNDATMLLERPLPSGGFALAPRASITASVEKVDADVLLCGHTHTPRIIHVQRTTTPLTIVNPGSVGLPGFEDGGHYFDNGTPHARYALLKKHKGIWTTDFIAIEYDWHRAARRAADNGRAEWARALLTGYSAPTDV